MEIKTEKDIDGDVAKAKRKELGLSQPKFWGPVGVSQTHGSLFETKRSTRLTTPIRILLFARYFAGLDIDASTEEGAAGLVRLAQHQSAARAHSQD
jgi:hypothetical protein